MLLFFVCGVAISRSTVTFCFWLFSLRKMVDKDTKGDMTTVSPYSIIL
jgi:hypothetical protein